MRYELRVARKDTGEESTITIDAASRSEAEKAAGYRGYFVVATPATETQPQGTGAASGHPFYYGLAGGIGGLAAVGGIMTMIASGIGVLMGIGSALNPREGPGMLYASISGIGAGIFMSAAGAAILLLRDIALTGRAPAPSPSDRQPTA